MTIHPITPLRTAEISIDDATYVGATLAQLWEEMPLLLLGSLLVAGSIAPGWWLVVTGGVVAPACIGGIFVCAPLWTAYCYLVGRHAVGYKAHLRDLGRAFVHYYRRALVIAIPVAILAILVHIALPVAVQAGSVLVVAGVTVQVIALCGVILLTLHALPLLALFDLPLRQVWAVSLALVVRWPLVALGLAAMAFLGGSLARLLGLGVWLILPLILTPFVVNATLLLTRQLVDVTKADVELEG
ncbi:MAG: hypothetical protein DYG89_24235 [Caldilinea sp. CFX5]|nr:hypothetical protein [Caldilinea sp. CFX5]